MTKDTDALREAGNTVRRVIGPTILTYGGEYFDYENPEGSFFNIADIARGLSHICRFAGQSSRFYSVAEHSVYVSRIVPPEHALAGLMHDAAEAFVGDMAKPLKVMIPEYQAIEKRIERAVLDRFGLTLPLHPSVKEADIVMLATEQAQVMNNRDDWDYTRGRAVANVKIEALSPNEAFDLFIDRYEELTGLDCEIPRFRAALATPASDDLRANLFEIIRRHNVGEQCFAEVAALTFVRPAPTSDVAPVVYGDAAQDAVMRLLERGIATVNSDGYLTLADPPARPVDPVAGGEDLREALRQARDYLLEVGNDYPGSSCQKWCAEKAAEIWGTLKPWEHCPSTHCERAQQCRSPNECSANTAALKGPAA